jgi:hypothetical protein
MPAGFRVDKFRRISRAGMRIRVLIGSLLVAGGALAQDAPPAYQRGDLGVRYWLSSGETRHAHNAQGVVPSLGNPTSVLRYENLDANALELFGRETFARDWFLKGFVGVGRINTGSFDDEDFRAGQQKFSDVTSSVSSGWLSYGVLDVGHQWALKQGAVNLGVFAGYGQWTEEVDASGATDHLGFIGGDIDRSTNIISNKLTWKALRIGFVGQVRLGSRVRLGVDLALIPYAQYRNEDSHHLRTNPNRVDFLGPVPNIIMQGDGRGVQLDAEIGYEVFRRTVFALGWRYWYMESTDGTRSVPGVPGAAELPVTELYSKRTGLTASLRYLW